MNIEQKSESTTSEGTKFKLVCNTNINKKIQHKISWLKNDKDLVIENNSIYKQTTIPASNTSYASSVLEFNWRLNRTFNFDGVYKCKILVRYPEVGQGASYISEPRNVKFVFNGIFFVQV
jgi:hypothetical protein